MDRTLLVPQVEVPFPLLWGFTTRDTTAALLPPRRLHQVHGCGVLEVPPGSTTLGQEGDGLWTEAVRTRLGVRVADCVPVLLAGWAQDRPWIAAVHAGWRGAVAGILDRAVGIFQARGGQCGSLYFAFGPCIQPCHFEVGDEVIAAARRHPAWEASLALPGPSGKPHLDLHGLLRAQALHLGLDPAKDGSIRRCTCCERDLFFSYRCGDREGRQWGLIELP